MSTQVKVITRDGQYGLIMHKHGNSAWHPANEKHSASIGTNDDTPESHTIHKAGHVSVFNQLQAFANEEVSFESLKADYTACLAGTPQAFWNEKWKAKLAARKANRLAREKAAAAPVQVLTPAGFSDPRVMD